MYAKPLVTQKLLDDAMIDMESWVLKKIAQQMAVVENQGFLKGDGKTQPMGILSYPRSTAAKWGQFEEVSITKEQSQKAADLTESFIRLFYALKPNYLNNATWLMSRQTLSLVRRLKDEKTGHFIWQPSLAAEAPSLLLGHPVIVLDDLVGEGTAIFGDMRKAYQIVDRKWFTVLRDPYSSKPYVEFYATRRVGGAAVDFEALKFLTVK